ncbi:MAG: plasmid encoded RepA protein [Treponema sp.]|nr:plasmid encoded RepA protein [Treponema sp.]
MTKKDETRELVPVNDDTSLEALFDLVTTGEQPKYLSYIPGLFTTASLPFKNVKKTVFTRKGSQGLTLTLTSPINVPFGRYGRLLLTVLTTHAVLSKEKNVPVMIEYNSLSELLKEMQLPRQRGKDIKEQLDCFTNATFAFTHKETTLKSGYLFKDIYEDGNYPKKDVEVTTKTTGSIRFTTGVQFQEIDDKVTEKKYGNFKIVISAEFANFCQKHAVPIDYGIYKSISSAVGKDIYAWLVFRNNGLKDSAFIPRDKLVEQFMPVAEDKDPNTVNVNYAFIVNQLNEIKRKYYPELKIDIDSQGSGITLYKSPTPVIKNDTRYALITSML